MSFQQQKTALMKNNVPLRAKSKNNGTNLRNELHILPHSRPVFFPSSLLSISLSVCSSVIIKILFSLLTCWNIFSFLQPILFIIQLFFPLSSRNARTSNFSYLPLWKLPTISAQITPWPLSPIPVQECLHQQHRRVGHKHRANISVALLFG